MCIRDAQAIINQMRSRKRLNKYRKLKRAWTTDHNCQCKFLVYRGGNEQIKIVFEIENYKQFL